MGRHGGYYIAWVDIKLSDDGPVWWRHNICRPLTLLGSLTFDFYQLFFIGALFDIVIYQNMFRNPYRFINVTEDDCRKANILKMTWWSWRWVRQFPCVFLATNIFCHTYISLYVFLHIFWYKTLSNYASIKNNWYKSAVIEPRNVIGRRVLWRHHSVSHLLRVFCHSRKYDRSPLIGASWCWAD